MNNLEHNITKVRARIQYAASQNQRNYENIHLLAVSKTQSAESVRHAWLLGLSHFGENYVQEALEKQKALKDLAIIWHFIGHIQSNKTAAIASHFDWVHTLDSEKVATRLSNQRPRSLRPIQCCLQININNENTKSGIGIERCEAMASAIKDLPGINLRGLMVIPDPAQPDNQLQYSFEKTRDTLTHLQSRFPDLQLDTLSMGMSRDMELAIAAGSTIVRVGTDIFGPRVHASRPHPETTDNRGLL
ncbi:MAG: YggS family pyridoxal phosphate-dependent enzyme [Pseudomonadales bacterium]|nr:YggS family pyridoxal phosphate-dependent enzyme [Pseudomonadales bacterium]